MDAFDLRNWEPFAALGGVRNQSAIVDQVCIDSRRVNSTQALFVALEGGMDGHHFVGHAAKKGARYALVRKNWQPPSDVAGKIILLAVDDPLKAFQSLAEAYRRQLKCKVIAIAGTHGKTMVKDLLLLLASQNRSVAASPESFNSQIGVALSLFTLKREHEIALIEMAVSKPHEMDALAAMVQPDAVILTHLGKKHLSTLGSLEASGKEITRLLHHPKSKAWALLPKGALPHCEEKNAAAIHCWELSCKNLPHASALSSQRSQKIPYQIDFPDGNHYHGAMTTAFYYFLDLVNIAVKAAWLLGATSEDIHRCLKEFTPEPMRTEIWRSPAGLTLINDAYCGDPQSVDQALKFYDQVAGCKGRIFLFGGMRGNRHNADHDYRRIGEAIAQAQLKLLVLVGEHPFKTLIEEVGNHSPQTEVILAESDQIAFEEVQKHVDNGDVLLIKGERKIPLDLLIDAFNESLCNNHCIINLEAIKSNLATIHSKLNDPKGKKNHQESLKSATEMMVIVKAFAYGTDEVQIAKFLMRCGIKRLGVSYTDEAVVLRRAGVTQEIFVIHAAPYEAVKVVRWNLAIGISDSAMVEALAAAAASERKWIKVHLHVDTGMGRFGCRPEEALELARQIQQHSGLELEGIMTHFAAADDPDEDRFTLLQVKIFDEVIAALHAYGIDPRWKHASNSSGALRFDFPQYNMVRIGLAAYGLHASEATSDSLELKRALSLVSRIVGINNCKPGESISYGRSYRIEKENCRIAVLPVGYFDGLHRNYSGKGHVIIRGQKAPMVGTICMDFMMVDITEIPEAIIGDRALIFGDDEHGHTLSAEELAGKGSSIVHELITCLGPRIQRIFIHEEANGNAHG